MPTYSWISHPLPPSFSPSLLLPPSLSPSLPLTLVLLCKMAVLFASRPSNTSSWKDRGQQMAVRNLCKLRETLRELPTANICFGILKWISVMFEHCRFSLWPHRRLFTVALPWHHKIDYQGLPPPYSILEVVKARNEYMYSWPMRTT